MYRWSWYFAKCVLNKQLNIADRIALINLKYMYSQHNFIIFTYILQHSPNWFHFLAFFSFKPDSGTKVSLWPSCHPRATSILVNIGQEKSLRFGFYVEVKQNTRGTVFAGKGFWICAVNRVHVAWKSHGILCSHSRPGKMTEVMEKSWNFVKTMQVLSFRVSWCATNCNFWKI